MTSPRVRWIEPWTASEGAEHAAAAFRSAFGAEPQGVWSAPGRVNVIGEHTDYNGGLCLPIALPHRTYVALAAPEPAGEAAPEPVGAAPATAPTTTEGRLRLVATQISEGGRVDSALADVAPGAVSGWSAYVQGVPWALAQAGHRVSGFDAAIDSCVPFGAGLSSSAALECAIAAALTDAFGLRGAQGASLLASDEGRAQLAAACVRAENEIAGAPTGGMDQAASLRCTEGHALLLDCHSGRVRQVPFDLAAEELELLVIDTKAHHALVDGQYAERRASCERAAQLLGVATLREVTNLPEALAYLRAHGEDDAERLILRVRHVVSEIARTAEAVALLDGGRIAAIGPLLDDSHASLRDHYEVSCAELDTAVEAAKAAGALGARMTGGGFGGSAIALIPAAIRDQVAAAVAAAFAERGFAAPEFLVALPSAPAGRTV